MNELLPYEEQLAGKMADIPLPEENPAWDAMRKMLDDDDGDGILPPPAAGCRRWGLGVLLLLLLVGITWGVYRIAVNNNSIGESKRTLRFKKQHIAVRDSIAAYDFVHHRIDTVGISRTDDSVNTGFKKDNGKTVQTPGLNKRQRVSSAADANFKVKSGRLATDAGGESVSGKRSLFGLKTKPGETGSDNGALELVKKSSAGTGIADSLKDVIVNAQRTKNTTNSGKETNGNPPPSTGDIVKPSGTSPLKKDSTGALKQKPLTAKRVDSPALKRIRDDKTDDSLEAANKIWFSGGLGLQQLIPVDGQKANPYNAFGRKGSLADYIPSVYLRLHQKRKFLQVEFKYGAPQYTKNIAYSTKVISVDTLNHITTSAVNHVEKTYYHQLPVSVHYEVLPGLSVGAGVVWNRFQSAVVNQQTYTLHTLTGMDTLTGSKVIDVKSDSAFAKTYWQFMAEAQYAWKRISFGARYSAGLQPFITYTSPVTGQTRRERNASLNVFIRYELWRSKKK